ncbi:DUF6011 domain-containing protein [Roseiconus lacunae]|uniref:DUF6011 domain-containing protein n=1 Tax=Roseiconus lacunae TaxID=2605694 RepID=A0ABT7PFK6_9BACT|nr:DUF6011 domain-containing protein [Roseiconus lacunae]MDM4015273.1 DUF6011 domain-containing protein [Roseiconus lacunae]
MSNHKTEPLIATTNHDLMTRFGESTISAFRHMMPDKGDKGRSPALGLRLYASDHSRLVALKAGFDTCRQSRLLNFVEGEVLVGIEAELENQRAYSAYRCVRFLLRPDRQPSILYRSWSRANWGDGIAALESIAAEFLCYPNKVIGRCSRHCCVCGRSLADAESQSRGVGPECIGKLESGMFTTATLSTSGLLPQMGGDQ